MRWKRWEALPASFQSEAVRPYYDRLNQKKWARFWKRVFDLVMASLLLILCSLPLLCLALLIKLDSKGPVFYRQQRVTRYGRPFRIFKFRTMVVNADQIGSLVTVGEDPRVTRVGRKLRGLRLDELPQLINILLGEMSFVGTRPEVSKYVEAYSPEMLASLLMPAGVTSSASVAYKDEADLLEGSEDVDRTYIEEVLPAKMAYNLEDLRQFSLRRELGILWKTVCAVFG